MNANVLYYWVKTKWAIWAGPFLKTTFYTKKQNNFREYFTHFFSLESKSQHFDVDHSIVLLWYFFDSSDLSYAKKVTVIIASILLLL